MSNIYTVNDLLKTAAVAFNNRDEDTIQNLISVANDWLQPEAERDAQVALLESLLNGIEDITSLELDVSAYDHQLQGA